MTQAGGRTYAIPFERVWYAAINLVGGDLRGWRLIHANDDDGSIEAESSSRLWKRITEVHVTVTLDRDAQTRVDVSAEAATGHIGNRRRAANAVQTFLHQLDRTVGARPGQILDPTPNGAGTAF